MREGEGMPERKEESEGEREGVKEGGRVWKGEGG